uniref:SET domain-containing protein n=1 Tax=Chromera velia CCMP2878 TaxID=1169474 RepID=A0A0G4H075_9ALVE|eukprot:Cvel_24142.t1-p1 / transcript=Cvel_24142.t1 / gene=Cvel_24142 / organism=Chromera_velia_CCMP2878 / gene_product=hypothetical protein / transcript_product=hypothetical protein / location=Cvel_scaffold2576:53-8290(+) / protein_length=1698 / sequence_SO=supercontig / SO=protein_coding / is_pseudo=false
MKGGEGLSGKGEGGGALLEMEEGRGGQSVPPVVFHVPPECRQGGGVGQVRFVMGEHIQGRGKIWYDQRSEDAEPFEEYGVVHGGAEEEADGEEKDKEEEEEEIITGIVFDKNKNRWESFLVLPAPDEDKDGPLREVNIFYDVSSYGHDEAKERALQCRAEMERLRDRCLIFDPKIIRRIALEKFPPRPPKRKGGGKKKQGQQRPAEYPAVAAAAAAGVPQDRSQEPVNGPAGPAEPLQEEEEEQKEGGEKDVRTGMGSDTEKKAKRDSPEEKKTEKPHTRICRELMSLFGFNKGPVEKPEAIEKNASQAAAVRSSRRASSASPCPPPSGPLPKKKEGAPPAKQSPHPPSSASVQKKQKKKDGAPSGRLPRELLSLIDTSTHAQRRAAASVPPISARLSDGAAAAAARDGKRDSGVEGVSWDQKGSRWIAKGRLDGRVTLEKFPVSVHGETGVLQAAIAFREMMVGEEEKMHSRSSSVKRDEEDEGDNEGAENEEEEEEEEERGGLTGDRESGVTGVFWVGREHRRWVANIGMKGRQVYMYFPVLTHGDKEALKKAKECRAEMVRLRDNGCTDPEEMQQEIRRRFPVNSGAQEGGGVEEEEEEEEESEEEEEGGETEEDRIGGIRESGVTGVYWVGSHHIAWVAEIRTQNRPMRIQFPVKTHGERVALQKAKECRAEMLRLKENGLTDPEKMRQELRRKFPLGPVEVGGGEEEEEESEQEEEGEEESGSLAGNQESGVRGVRWVGGRHRAWKAEIRVQNRPMSLQFPISTHGDKEALQKAKECREEMERLKGMGWTDREKVRQELRRKFPLNSVSAEEGGSEDRGDEEDDEPVGVFWDCQNACWAAHIRIRGGQPKLSFPVKTYGKDGALKKAKECRREMEKMKEEGWTDLVSFRRELRRKFPAASGTVDGGRREEKEEEERERESGMKGVYWVGSSQRMWIAEIRILNSTVAIQFPLLSYGGDRRALQKAKECRTEMHRLREKGMTACEAIRKRLRRKFGQISKSSQKDEKAGMRGVKWDCHHACWVARVRFLGVQPKLSFPIKTHGENGALQKAKECRAEMEKQMKRKKWKNADEFREAIRRKFSVGVESGPRDDGGGRESPSEKKKKGGLNVGSQQRQKRSEVPLAKGERNLKRLKAKFKNAPAVSQFSSSSVVGVKWDKRNQAWEAVAGKNDQKSRRSGRRLKIQFLVSRFGEKEALERAMACRMEMERGERDLERLKEKFKNAPAISQSSSSSACASMGSQQKGKGKGGLQGGASACARKRQVGEASDSVCALPDPKRKKPSKRQEGKTDSDSSVVSSPARGRLPLSSGPSASLSRVALPRGASTAGQSSSLCTLKRRLAAPFLSVENRPGKERSSATSSLFGALKAEEGEDADAQRGGGAKRRKIQAPATGEEEDGEAMGDGGDDPIAFPSSSSSSSSSSCSSSSSESASRPLLEGGAGTGEAGLEQMGVEGGSEEAEGGRSHGEAVQKARDPEAEKALIAYAEKNRKPLMALLNPNRLPGTYTDKKTARDNRANRLARARAASEFTTVTAKTTRYLKARWCTPVILSGKAVAVIGDGVTVDTSMLGRVAGSGLFATKAFEEGDIVTEFVGYLLDRETAMRQKEKGTHSHIMTLVKNHSYLMCLKDVVAGLGGAHFANDGTVSKNGKPAPGVNAKNFWYFDKDMACTRVFLKATKRIEIGQEIFISYGEVYWR